jgi:hypothetical protein
LCKTVLLNYKLLFFIPALSTSLTPSNSTCFDGLLRFGLPMAAGPLTGSGMTAMCIIHSIREALWRKPECGFHSDKNVNEQIAALRGAPHP